MFEVRGGRKISDLESPAGVSLSDVNIFSGDVIWSDDVIIWSGDVIWFGNGDVTPRFKGFN